jgi:hypothetical protein
MRLLGRFTSRKPVPAPEPDPVSDMGFGPAYPQSGFTPRPTKDERYLQFLLGAGLPKARPHLEKHWLLASEVVKHLQLTNFPDKESYQKFKQMLTDQFRVGGWDADEYFDELQLKRFGNLMAQKSISWTRVPRERDALNEDRHTTVVRDDRTPIPRESPTLIGGMFSR